MLLYDTEAGNTRKSAVDQEHTDSVNNNNNIRHFDIISFCY